MLPCRLKNKPAVEGRLLLLNTQVADQVDGVAVRLNLTARVQNPRRTGHFEAKSFRIFATARQRGSLRERAQAKENARPC